MELQLDEKSTASVSPKSGAIQTVMSTLLEYLKASDHTDTAASASVAPSASALLPSATPTSLDDQAAKGTAEKKSEEEATKKKQKEDDALDQPLVEKSHVLKLLAELVRNYNAAPGSLVDYKYNGGTGEVRRTFSCCREFEDILLLLF